MKPTGDRRRPFRHEPVGGGRSRWLGPADAAGLVHHFNALGIAGLSDRPRSGPRSRLGDGEQAVLKAMILRGPDPETDGVSTLRVADVCRICKERFGVENTQAGMLRVMKGLDLLHQKARPRHPQSDPAAQRAFQKRGVGANGDADRPLSPGRGRPASGSRTRPGAVRRGATRTSGTRRARARSPRPTSASSRPISTAPSVPDPTMPSVSSYRAPTRP